MNKLTLKEKLAEIKRLAGIINKNKDNVFHTKRAGLSEIKDRLEYRLSEKQKEFEEKVKVLAEEYAEIEADIKILSFQEAINVIMKKDV